MHSSLIRDAGNFRSVAGVGFGGNGVELNLVAIPPYPTEERVVIARA